MISLAERVAENYRIVRERIAAACSRAGRDPGEVTLIAVTKYAQIEWVRELVALGAAELGESRPQQLAERAKQISGGNLHWHLIGHLQRNKVKLVLPVATVIHSVDSVRLAGEIDRTAEKLNIRPRVLIELNLTGEEAKHGVRRDELLAVWEQLLAFPRLRIEGLMTMAAYSDNPEDARPTFAALRELREELRRHSPSQVMLPHLSMGMTGDFEVAIEEGATMVRIGSALWENLE